MVDFIGQSIGRYHILERLGEGGMATVYKAFDTRLENNVAVKVIRQDALGQKESGQLIKRFEREAKSLARLNHINIVKVIDYGDFHGSPYLVMPYLPGGTLKDLMGRPFPYAEAARLLLPVARALEYAHQQSMIHRDIKPSNILVTPSGDLVLSDFGIAKLLEVEESVQLTGTGMGLGTPEYMAPEQWLGNAGPASDQYGLAVIFYELVTGRKPYIAETPAAVFLKQANDPLPRPRQFIPDLPEAVERLLVKALAKEPENRYRDMTAFVTALEKLALAGNNQPTSAQATSAQATSAQATSAQATSAQVPGGAAAGAEPALPAGPTVDALPAPQPVRKRLPAWAWIAALVGIVGLVVLLSDVLAGGGGDGETQATQVAWAAAAPTSAARVTQTSTATPSPTPTPTSVFGDLPVIGPENAASIGLKSRLGLGTGWTVDISPDGQYLAAGGSGGIDIYRMNDYQMVHHLETGGMAWVQFFPDSKKVAGGRWQEASVQIWDAISGERLQEIKGGPNYETVLAISPNGRYLAYATDDPALKVWDFQTNTQKWSLKTRGTVRVIVFSPDSAVIASGSTDAVVNIWDAATGEVLLEEQAHAHQIQGIAISPDGQTLATTDWAENMILWDLPSRTKREEFTGVGYVWGADFSPDGKKLAFSVWGSPRYFDMQTKEFWTFPEGASNNVEILAFTPDGKVLAGAGYNHVTLWDAGSGKIIHRFPGYASEYTNLSFSPDGKNIAAVSTSSIPNSLHVYGPDGHVAVDLKNGYTDMVAYSAAYSPDGKYLASGAKDDAIHLWDAATLAEVKRFTFWAQDVRKVAFSPGSQWLAAGYEDGTIWLWDVVTGKKLSMKDQPEMVTALAYSPDGRLLASGSKDQAIKIWDAQAGALLYTLGEQLGEVYELAFSPDGRYLVSASYGDGTGNAILWDLQKKERARSLTGRLKNVKAIAYSPDGRLIATGDDEGTIILYEASTGVILKDWSDPRQHNQDPITSLQFSPDGRVLAAGKGDGLIWEYAVDQTP